MFRFSLSVQGAILSFPAVIGAALTALIQFGSPDVRLARAASSLVT